MRVGIDASNLREGGGLTHLSQLLRAARPAACGIERVVVWGGRRTLGMLPDSLPWLELVHEPRLDQALPQRLYWQWAKLPQRAAQACDALLVPGGTYVGTFHPVVTMSRNMLPFEPHELRRYGFSWIRLRLMLLRLSQSSSFAKSDGVIFLTRYAHDRVLPMIHRPRGRAVIIPHGVDARFNRAPRPARSLAECSPDRPFKLLYVSIVDLYKHQWHVATAVGALRRQGIPLELTLVGPAYPPALGRLREAMARVDPDGTFIRYLGPLPYDRLPALCHQADGCVFASSCENMPNILLEAMAAGLPIACSDRGPMPDILGEAGLYFDPERPDDLAEVLGRLLRDSALRDRLAKQAYAASQTYSWERCAHETLAFISQVAAGASH